MILKLAIFVQFSNGNTSLDHLICIFYIKQSRLVNFFNNLKTKPVLKWPFGLKYHYAGPLCYKEIL
jgi:hypothetical protein